MPWTLQRYIFAETGKAFLLTAAALTAVLSLGGGMVNTIGLGDVTPGQLVKLLLLVLPLAVALTLPISALFGSTAAYGRLSAANEFVACRSSGINILLLFLPVVVLSLLSAATTFLLINLLVPGMLKNLTTFASADAVSFVEQRLRRAGGLRYGDFRFHKEGARFDRTEAGLLGLSHVVFLEVDGAQWARVGSVEELTLRAEFEEGTLVVSGHMKGVSYFDRTENRFVDVGEMDLPRNPLPGRMFSAELKFLNLFELLDLRGRPQDWPPVGEQLDRVRSAEARLRIYDELWNDWLNGKELALSGGDSTCTIRSRTIARVPGARGLELAEVSLEHARGDETRRFEAERAVIEVEPAGEEGAFVHRVELFGARRMDEEGTQTPTQRVVFRDLPVDPRYAKAAQAVSDAALLEQARPDDPLAELRSTAREKWDDTVREITAVLNERLVFSLSVLVLVLLGAALGIVMRGAHLLTAFGISFVPSLVVLVLVVMGKQLTGHAATADAGLAVMWSGLGLVALLDVVVLTRVLRR